MTYTQVGQINLNLVKVGINLDYIIEKLLVRVS